MRIISTIMNFYRSHLISLAQLTQAEVISTVNSLINGHSKRRTPPISGQNFFHRQNLGQILIKNIPKSGQAINGHSN